MNEEAQKARDHLPGAATIPAPIDTLAAHIKVQDCRSCRRQYQPHRNCGAGYPAAVSSGRHAYDYSSSDNYHSDWHRPTVVFLDEPTLGLDVVARQCIRDLIGQLNAEEGLTVCLTSHDAGDIEQVCQRAIVINHGKIVLDAPMTQLTRDYLQIKTVDLLLAGNTEELVQTDAESGLPYVNILLPGSRNCERTGMCVRTARSSSHTCTTSARPWCDDERLFCEKYCSLCHGR
jgi:hypothetical protein